MQRYNPDYKEGLSTDIVNKRKAENLNNVDTTLKTKTIGQIIKSNCFTYFNFLNIFLSLTVLIVGTCTGYFFAALKNSLFLGVIFCNTIISTIQEVISKKIVDKLSLLSEAKTVVIRDGKKVEIDHEDIVLDDVLFLEIGNQVPVDSVVLNGEVEVNESFITGESDAVTKRENEMLLSGSFIVSSSCYAKVEHVGGDNYISSISNSAKYEKKVNSVIMDSFNIILKVISIIIIPIAILLFYNQTVAANYNYTDAVFATVGALIGMIPEGLILLTSSVMAVSIIKLSKYKVLVQQLYSLEALARVDVICLDKTGTITNGNMELKDVVIKDQKEDVFNILANITNALDDKSATFMAIKDKYGLAEDIFDITKTVPFSSKRKYSAIETPSSAYYLGAPEFVLKDDFENIESEIKKYQEDYRVLVLAKRKRLDDDLKPTVIAYLLICDIIRKEAPTTIAYFKDQGVKVKIISGDNLTTVTNIAKKAGVGFLKGIDASNIDKNNIREVVEEYDIIARATPTDKKNLIKAMQKNGHVVCMTGDGVNDVMALKEADSSVAMASGSDAARNVSQIVLLNSNFDAMPKVVLEGRRTINNIERSASLLLMKTIFTILLIAICIITGEEYFFVPVQLSLLNMFNVGIPSFILALEPNKERIKGSFLLKILSKSLPAALTIVFNISIICLLKNYLGLPKEMATWLNIWLTSAIGFIFLYNLCKPFTIIRKILYGFLTISFLICAICFHDFFDMMGITFYNVILFLVFCILSVFIFNFFNKLVYKLLDKFDK